MRIWGCLSCWFVWHSGGPWGAKPQGRTCLPTSCLPTSFRQWEAVRVAHFFVPNFPIWEKKILLLQQAWFCVHIFIDPLSHGDYPPLSNKMHRGLCFIRPSTQPQSLVLLALAAFCLENETGGNPVKTIHCKIWASLWTATCKSRG